MGWVLRLGPARCGVIACLCWLAVGAGAARAKLIFEVRGAGIVTLAQMVEDLQRSRVVIMGESHSDADHHAAQLSVIQALHAANGNVAVGLEMFRANGQADLDGWTAGELAEEEFFAVYGDHWDPRYWPLYAPIFRYARQERIPLVGLNVSRAIVNQVAREGFASLSEAQRGELDLISCDVDAKYQNLLAQVVGAKDQDSDSFGRFCEAQVVWDTAMAGNAVRYLEQNPNKILVILAGSFHAWKHGIAEHLERRTDLPYRVILPSSDDSYFNYNILKEDADYVWWFD